MKKAFTLIEVAVAVAIFAMVLSFASVIFKAGIEGHRASTANAEIMQKLRAITDQFNTDFKALRTDAPLLIWFQQDSGDPNRYDQIMFFANGDFQSMQLYNKTTGEPDDDGDEPIIGNVARIYYGQAQSRDPNSGNMKDPFEIEREKARLFARRRHILTADPGLDDWPDYSNVGGSFNYDVFDPQGYNNNERYEHDSLSLSQWKTIDIEDYQDAGEIIDVCFNFRPWVDMEDPNTFHKLLCDGLSSFAIQWAYWNPDPNPVDDQLRWYPSDDPYGDGSGSDSHFRLIGDEFGIYFNIPGTGGITNWDSIKDAEYKSEDYFPIDFYPKALKFTFTLYDSKGIIKKGRRFTHIVYLEN